MIGIGRVEVDVAAILGSHGRDRLRIQFARLAHRAEHLLQTRGGDDLEDAGRRIAGVPTLPLAVLGVALLV